jgi:hypothetical protein
MNTSEHAAADMVRSLEDIASEYVALDLRKKSIETKMAPLKKTLIERMLQGAVERIEVPALALVSFVSAKDSEAIDTDKLVVMVERFAEKLKKLGMRVQSAIPMKPTHASATVKITHRHGLNPET